MTGPAEASQAVLSDTHRRMLGVESGLTPETIAARGYRTVSGSGGAGELARLGFNLSQAHTATRGDVLVVPLWGADQTVVGHQIRPDVPRPVKGGLKYETPAGALVRVDVPPAGRELVRDGVSPLWVTEGAKTADALAQAGAATIMLAGVWGFMGRQATGIGTAVIEDMLSVPVAGRTVLLAYDSDVSSKPEVHAAERRLAAVLSGRGALVQVVRIPAGPNGEKQGADDYLAAGGTLAALVATAQDPESADALNGQHPAAFAYGLLTEGHEYRRDETGAYLRRPTDDEGRCTGPARRYERAALRDGVIALSRERGVLGPVTPTIAGTAVAALAHDLGDTPPLMVGAHVLRDGARTWIDTGRHGMICLSGAGWGYVAWPDVPMWVTRTGHVVDLPVPATPDERTREPLRALLDVDTETFALAWTWLVSVLACDQVPLLWWQGAAGSGKSTRAGLLGSVLGVPEPSAVPRNVQDAQALLHASPWLSVENLGGLDPAISDLWCTAVTDGMVRTRVLHTTREVAETRRRWTGQVTSLSDVGGVLDDLLTRALVVSVSEPSAAVEVGGLREAAAAIRPAVLGALLDDAVAVLAQEGPAIAAGYRFPGVSRVARVLDERYGGDAHARALRDVTAAAMAERAEGDPWVQWLVELARSAEGGVWTGTATELLDTQREHRRTVPTQVAMIEDDRAEWPQNVRQVGRWLPQRARRLLTEGVRWSKTEVGKAKTKQHVLRVDGVGTDDLAGESGPGKGALARQLARHETAGQKGLAGETGETGVSFSEVDLLFNTVDSCNDVGVGALVEEVAPPTRPHSPVSPAYSSDLREQAGELASTRQLDSPAVATTSPPIVRAHRVTRSDDPTVGTLDEMRAELAGADPLTVDVETSGFPVGHVRHVLRTVQLGHAEVAWVLDVRDLGDDSHTPVRAAVAELLASAPRLQAHSATADLVPLAHAGLIDEVSGWARMHDTVIAAKLADPQSTGADPGLKQLAGAVLGDLAVSTDADKARKAAFTRSKWLTNSKPDSDPARVGWAQIDPADPVMLRYAAGDVLDTAALALRLPAPDPAVLARERAVETITARVTHRGLRVDAERVEALYGVHQAAADEAEARAAALGVPEPSKTRSVCARLIELGATLPTTDKGNPSVTEAVLAGMRGEPGDLGALASAVLDYREHSKVISSFLMPAAQSVVNGDGRLRPTVYTLGADTGRMCLPTEHCLVTPDGFVASVNVREGMWTLDARGRWTRVLKVHRYKDAPIQTLGNRGIDLAGTPEHRWVTTRDHEAAYAARMGREAPERELRRWDDHPRLRVHLAPDVEAFDFGARTVPAETEDQRFAALVGLLVTDGRCVDDEEPGVGMRAYVYQTEAKFYDEFRRVIPAEAVMYDRVTQSGNAHHEIRIAARWLRPRLDAAGLACGALLKESADLYRWVAGLPLGELRAFFAACWLADGTLAHQNISCGSANLRRALTLAAYRLGVVAYEMELPPSEWSNGPRPTLVFRRPVLSTRKSVRGERRGDVWCVTTEAGTFTAVNPHGMVYLTGNSCVRPNIQQWPREGGFRATITADPGHTLVSADFSGVEIRVAAALSGDPTLHQMIHAGRDLHAEIALQVWGADEEATKAAGGAPTARKIDRYSAKRIVFGRLYGGGITTLARQAGVPESLASSAIDVLDEMTPVLTDWSRRIRDAVRAGHRMFPTYAGRIIHLTQDTPHKAPNYCIQGTARELLVDALLRWDAGPFGGGVVIPVHDEIVAMVPDDRAEEATAALVAAMSTTLSGVPIAVTPSAPSRVWEDSL